MLIGEFNVLIVVVFFAIVAAGVRVVDHLTDPGRDRSRPPAVIAFLASLRERVSQRQVPVSPVEKRKPTPGSVST